MVVLLCRNPSSVYYCYHLNQKKGTTTFHSRHPHHHQHIIMLNLFMYQGSDWIAWSHHQPRGESCWLQVYMWMGTSNSTRNDSEYFAIWNLGSVADQRQWIYNLRENTDGSRKVEWEMQPKAIRNFNLATLPTQRRPLCPSPFINFTIIIYMSAWGKEGCGCNIL